MSDHDPEHGGRDDTNDEDFFKNKRRSKLLGKVERQEDLVSFIKVHDPEAAPQANSGISWRTFLVNSWTSEPITGTHMNIVICLRRSGVVLSDFCYVWNMATGYLFGHYTISEVNSMDPREWNADTTIISFDFE